MAGRSPQQIGAEIARRLVGRANKPQVLVRVTRNATANVTVVGEVAQSVRMPLTAKGDACWMRSLRPAACASRWAR